MLVALRLMHSPIRVEVGDIKNGIEQDITHIIHLNTENERPFHFVVKFP